MYIFPNSAILKSGMYIFPKSTMFSNRDNNKIPVTRLKSLSQKKKRLFLMGILVVTSNLLVYGLVSDRNLLPNILQSSYSEVYNQSLLNLLSRGNETHLTPTLLPPRVWVESKSSWNGYQLPIITCKPLGRLGNVMGEYATLFALHRHYNVSVLLHPQMKDILHTMFPNLTMPLLPGAYEDGAWKKVGNIGDLYNYAPIELAASGLLGPHHFQIISYPFEIQLFQPFKEAIIKEFKFSENITRKVETFKNEITAKWHNQSLPTPVFVGFHVRRTDYAAHAKNMFGAKLPGIRYFNQAMNYYRLKFGNATVFIAASDDKPYIKSRIGTNNDVFLAPSTVLPKVLTCTVLITNFSYKLFCFYQ